MCIICIKPVNVKDFDDEILKHCWDKNDDGGGFAYWNSTKDVWVVQKGFLTYKKFIRAYKEHHFTEQDAVIVHFRIGTSGLKDKGNTHPFQICDDFSVMRKREFESKNIAFHNGVVGKGEGDFSDTMVHIRDYLFPIYPLWEDTRIQGGIAQTLLEKNGSRWVVCVGNVYHLFGTFHEYKGWKFSNFNYQPWTPANVTPVYSVVKNEGPQNNTYKNLSDAGRLPLGQWNFGIKGAYSGFWRGNNFKSWEDYAKEIGFIPSTKNPKGGRDSFFQEQITIKTEEEFYQRYVLTSASKDGKCLTVFNFRVFAMDLHIQRKRKDAEAEKKKNVIKNSDLKTDQVATGIMDDDGSFAWDGKDEEEMTDELKDFKMCPSCFSDLIGESPFTIGDSICMICGCVFTLATGEIQTYDADIHKKFMME